MTAWSSGIATGTWIAFSHPFKTVVIDTIDVLYRHCADHICQKRGLEHESDGAHGKVYGLMKNEIYRVLAKLAHLPYGLILISHSQDRDLETRTGTVTRTVPTLSESFRQIVIGLVDLILYCDVQSEQDENVAPTAPRDPHQAQPQLRRRRPLRLSARVLDLWTSPPSRRRSTPTSNPTAGESAERRETAGQQAQK